MSAPGQLEAYPWEYVGEPADAPRQPTAGEVEEGRRIAAALLEAAEQEPRPLQAAPWRLARAVEVARAEANAVNPARDKRSDGTIGDAAHATRASDHNPWVIVAGLGVVRALDLDVDGLDLAAAFERARQLAAAGKLPQLRNGGYLILNRRITRPDFSGWNTYNGPNPHTAHGHISTARDVAGFDSAAPWGIFAPPPPAPLPPVPTTLKDSPMRLAKAVGTPGPVHLISELETYATHDIRLVDALARAYSVPLVDLYQQQLDLIAADARRRRATIGLGVKVDAPAALQAAQEPVEYTPEYLEVLEQVLEFSRQLQAAQGIPA